MKGTIDEIQRKSRDFENELTRLNSIGDKMEDLKTRIDENESNVMTINIGC